MMAASRTIITIGNSKKNRLIRIESRGRATATATATAMVMEWWKSMAWLVWGEGEKQICVNSASRCHLMRNSGVGDENIINVRLRLRQGGRARQ